MTKDEALKLAREKANSILIDLIGKPKWDKGCTEQHLIDFAALVAAAENEECEKLAEIAEPYQAADLIRARRKV